MDLYSVFTVILGLTVAIPAGLLVYRDASTRGLTYPAIWSILTGTISGVGVTLSVQSSLPIYRIISEGGRYVAIHPFDLLLIGLFVGLAISAIAISTYMLGTRFGPFTVQA